MSKLEELCGKRNVKRVFFLQYVNTLAKMRGANDLAYLSFAVDKTVQNTLLLVIVYLELIYFYVFFFQTRGFYDQGVGSSRGRKGLSGEQFTPPPPLCILCFL